MWLCKFTLALNKFLDSKVFRTVYIAMESGSELRIYALGFGVDAFRGFWGG